MFRVDCQSSWPLCVSPWGHLAVYGCLGEIVISQGLFVSLLEDISQYMYVQGRLSFLKASLCLSLRCYDVHGHVVMSRTMAMLWCPGPCCDVRTMLWCPGPCCEVISQYMYVQGRLSFIMTSLCITLRSSRSVCIFRGDCLSTRPLCVWLWAGTGFYSLRYYRRQQRPHLHTCCFRSIFSTKLSTSLQLMSTEFKSTRRLAPRCCLYNDQITIALFQSRPLAVVSILPPPTCARS